MKGFPRIVSVFEPFLWSLLQSLQGLCCFRQTFTVMCNGGSSLSVPFTQSRDTVSGTCFREACVECLEENSFAVEPWFLSFPETPSPWVHQISTQLNPSWIYMLTGLSAALFREALQRGSQVLLKDKPMSQKHEVNTGTKYSTSLIVSCNCLASCLLCESLLCPVRMWTRLKYLFSIRLDCNDGFSKMWVAALCFLSFKFIYLKAWRKTLSIWNGFSAVIFWKEAFSSVGSSQYYLFNDQRHQMFSFSWQFCTGLRS